MYENFKNLRHHLQTPPNFKQNPSKYPFPKVSVNFSLFYQNDTIPSSQLPLMKCYKSFSDNQSFSIETWTLNFLKMLSTFLWTIASGVTQTIKQKTAHGRKLIVDNYSKMSCTLKVTQQAERKPQRNEIIAYRNVFSFPPSLLIQKFNFNCCIVRDFFFLLLLCSFFLPDTEIIIGKLLFKHLHTISDENLAFFLNWAI